MLAGYMRISKAVACTLIWRGYVGAMWRPVN